jgi:3,4-dihydroxy 2-butanone 4-phosphate synthase/GTP cyclohydrolase II
VYAKAASARLPIDVGGAIGLFNCSVYAADASHEIVFLHIDDAQPGTVPLIRVHSACLTGDVFGSLRCDCGSQLRTALRKIMERKKGGVIYIRHHEGRGIGLLNKIKAYSLQQSGLDTVEANGHLGFPADLRDFECAADVLDDVSWDRIDLLSNNPKKVLALRNRMIHVRSILPMPVTPNEFNRTYLKTKVEKLGHQGIEADDDHRRQDYNSTHLPQSAKSTP